MKLSSLTDDKRKRIRTNLWNYFQPIHKHLGFENSSTVYNIMDVLKKKCNLKFKNESEETIFRNNITCKIFNSLMNNKSKLYIRGLLCEPISISEKGKTRRLGHFYIVKDLTEIKRVKAISEKSISGRSNSVVIRTHESYEFLKQLKYDCDKDRKRLLSKKYKEVK